MNDDRQPIDEYRGEVPPVTPASLPILNLCGWRKPTGELWTPEPATDPYEMEAE